MIEPKKRYENNAFFLFWRRKGFTLIELFALIVIIAILAAIFIPTGSHVKKHATITICLNNEKQQVVALAMYAAENQDNLPLNSIKPDAGQLALHPWTMDAYVANKLIANGPQPVTFFDPGTEPAFGPTDWFGKEPYGPVPGGTPSLWTFSSPYPASNAVAGQSGYRVTGYTQTLPGNPCYGTPEMSVFTNVNQKLTTTNENPAKKIVVACATFTDSPNILASGAAAASDDYQIFTNYSWTGQNSFGEKYNGKIKPFISAHLAKGTKRIGGNEAMLDGHVEWRTFQNMIHRTANGPFFYY